MTVHVGIDLAWGTTARSGIAAVDAAGRLLHSATVVSDEELDAWLGTLESIGTVAIDAPLEVPNATGVRACERALASAYGRYGCGCHVVNRARPWFDPPRGETLATRHGWSLDPYDAALHLRGGRPVAVEVYPHAALIGRFALGRVLPYKAKARRDLATRQQGLGTLVRLLESIPELALSTSPDWQEQTSAIARATRPVDLERLEDRLDAVLCAHLAWWWATAPQDLHVYGRPGEGAVVAPPPPTHPR